MLTANIHYVSSFILIHITSKDMKYDDVLKDRLYKNKAQLSLRWFKIKIKIILVSED